MTHDMCCVTRFYRSSLVFSLSLSINFIEWSPVFRTGLSLKFGCRYPDVSKTRKEVQMIH